MAFEDYHSSRSTLERLENTFKNGYLNVLKLIAKSPDFFNGELTGEELFHEFVEIPFNEIKDREKKKNHKGGNGIEANGNGEENQLKISKKYRLNRNKCYAIIHLKHELRQCQSNPTPDDYLCIHHSKLDVLPYGIITFDD